MFTVLYTSHYTIFYSESKGLVHKAYLIRRTFLPAYSTLWSNTILYNLLYNLYYTVQYIIVSLCSRFARKESTSSTGDLLFNLGCSFLTRYLYTQVLFVGAFITISPSSLRSESPVVAVWWSGSRCLRVRWWVPDYKSEATSLRGVGGSGSSALRLP